MSEVNERTQRTSLLRGPVEDIPGLTSYLAANFLPIAGGTMAGDLDMDQNAISRALQITFYDETALDEKTLLADNSLLIFQGQPLATQAYASNASNLASGTVPDNRLSANVPLKNAASNAFTGPVTSGGSFTAANGNNGFAGGGIAIGFSGVSSGLIAGGQLNVYESGVSKESIVASQGFNLASDRGIYFSSTTASSGSKDVSLVRNATGPTLETRAAGGLKVCNADGSAVAAVQCSTITAGVAGTSSGQIIVGHSSSVNAYITVGGTVSQTISGQNNILGVTWQIVTDTTGSGGPASIRLGATGQFGFGSTAANIGTIDANVNRASAGVLQIGTTSNNALGSLNLANLTASAGSTASPSIRFGSDTNSGVYQVAANTVSFAASGAELLRVSNGSIVYCFAAIFNAYNDIVLGSSGGPRLRNNAGALRVTNNAGSADGDVQCANLTASGGITFGPRTKSALLATSATATAGCWRITDSTPAQRIAYPDGTNWRYLSDDTVVT